MVKIIKFKKYVSEKFVDKTGNVDKSVLDYWNGLYYKWTRGTLTTQEKSDYEKASAAKIYYIYEDKNSDVYKKLMDFEKKASDEAKNRDSALSASKTNLNYSDGAEIKGYRQLERTEYDRVGSGSALKPATLIKTTKTAGGHKPTMEAFHAFLDTIEVPWEEVCSELGIKVEKLPTKESWRKTLSNWFTKLGDNISDKIEKFNDWLFPEKTEAEMYRDIWKDRDIKSTIKRTGVPSFSSYLKNKKSIQDKREKIKSKEFPDFAGTPEGKKRLEKQIATLMDNKKITREEAIKKIMDRIKDDKNNPYNTEFRLRDLGI